MKRYQKQSPWHPWLSLEMLSRGPSPKAQVRWGLSRHLAASTRVKGVTTQSTFKGSSLQMCQPQVPRLCTRCDPWELRWGEELGVHSCRWRGHQHSLGNGWVHSGKEKKKCHFSFFLFEVTKLQGSGGDCCSDFILWEAGGCLPEAAARRVICIACPLWFWRGALPSLRPSASLESGPLPHTDCIRPLIFSPPLPLPDLYSKQFNKLPRQVPRTHPNHFESQLADKRGIISYTPGGWVLERGPLGDTPGSPCVSPSLSPFTPRSWHLVAGTSAGSDLLKQLRLLNFQLALTNLMGPWESSFPEGEANSLLCLGTFLKFHQGDAGAKRDGELVLWYGEACLQYNEAPLFFWRVQGKESREEWDREVA